MTGFKLLLVFSLLGGVFAEQCDIGDFAIDDFSNHVVVTNASKSEEALVILTYGIGDARFHLKAGASKTSKTLGTLAYSITVVPDPTPGVSYENSLLFLRDLLQDLSLDSSAPPSAVAEVLTQLFLVQSAVQQLDANRDAQSCSHEIGEGVDSRATVTWTETIGGTGLWVLDCG